MSKIKFPKRKPRCLTIAFFALLISLLGTELFAQDIKVRLKQARAMESREKRQLQTRLGLADPKAMLFYNDIAELKWLKDPDDGLFKAYYVFPGQKGVDIGKADGVYKEFYPSGIVRLIKIYHHGILISEEEFYPDGALKIRDTFKKERQYVQGFRVIYDEDGNLVQRYPIDVYGHKISVD